MKVLMCFVFLTFEFIVASSIDTKGSKVYYVTPVTEKDFAVLKDLEYKIPKLEVRQHVHHKVKMVVSEESVTLLESFLLSSNVHFKVFTEDPMSDLEAKAKHAVVRNSRDNSSISFAKFNRHSEINAYLDGLALNFPDRVSVETGGRTVSGREIKFIKISSSKGIDQDKPIIIVDAGMKGREWIVPSVALFMITKLVENITESDIADKIDWIIVPLLNPDGYEYTHDSGARLWRKNRSNPSGTNCFGVEINRNFDIKWMGSGSTSNPCSEIYAGPSPFSEVESRVLRDIIILNKKRVKAYVSLHSYGTFVLYPYGYDGSNASNANELHTLGKDIAFAMHVYAGPSVHYEVNNSTSLEEFNASGTSVDWAMDVAGIDLAYNIVLPGGGSAGWNIPPSRIDAIVRETWYGFIVLAKYVIKKTSN